MKSGDDKVQLNDVQMSLDGGVWDSPKRVEKTRDYIVADPASLGTFRDFYLVCAKPLSTAHKSPASTRNKYVRVYQVTVFIFLVASDSFHLTTN